MTAPPIDWHDASDANPAPGTPEHDRLCELGATLLHDPLRPTPDNRTTTTIEPSPEYL